MTLLTPFSRHLEGDGPYPSLGRLSRPLGSDVGLGVFAIGHSPAPLHQSVIEAHGAHEALSDRAAVSVYNSLLTRHRLVGDQIIQLGGGLLTIPVILAVPLAKLAALWGVDAVEPYSGTPDFQSVAISRRRGPGDVG